MTMEMQEQASIGWLSIDLSALFMNALNALFIVLYVICAMQIMSAIQPDTFFNVSLNTKIRQLASIFMKRRVGGIV